MTSLFTASTAIIFRHQFKNDPKVADIFALSVDGTASGDVGIGDQGNWIRWFATLARTELGFPEKS